MTGAGAASAHLERPSYWPDPAPDTGIEPAAGGAVPKARTLRSAVAKREPFGGDVRVVCKGAKGRVSLRVARRSIRRSHRSGFRLRPSQPKIKLSAKRSRRLLAINRKLARRCEYRSVQAAIDGSATTTGS